MKKTTLAVLALFLLASFATAGGYHAGFSRYGYGHNYGYNVATFAIPYVAYAPAVVPSCAAPPVAAAPACPAMSAAPAVAPGSVTAAYSSVAPAPVYSAPVVVAAPVYGAAYGVGYSRNVVFHRARFAAVSHHVGTFRAVRVGAVSTVAVAPVAVAVRAPRVAVAVAAPRVAVAIPPLSLRLRPIAGIEARQATRELRRAVR